MTWAFVTASHLQTEGLSALILWVSEEVGANIEIGTTINALVAKASEPILVIAQKNSASLADIHHAVKLLVEDTQVKACAFETPRILAVTREAWDRAGCADSFAWPKLISEFLARSKELRLFKYYEFVKSPHATAEKAKPVAAAINTPAEKVQVVEEPKEKKNTSLTMQVITEEEVLKLINTAVDDLKSDKNESALKILCQVIPRKTDMPTLYYARAVAEARLGLIKDAKVSLEALLTKDPLHNQGKALLEQLKSAR